MQPFVSHLISYDYIKRTATPWAINHRTHDGRNMLAWLLIRKVAKNSAFRRLVTGFFFLISHRKYSGSPARNFYFIRPKHCGTVWWFSGFVTLLAIASNNFFLTTASCVKVRGEAKVSGVFTLRTKLILWFYGRENCSFIWKFLRHEIILTNSQITR